MPALLIAAIGLAVLAAGEGINLAGQGTKKITDSTTQLMLIGAALYVGYLALRAK